MACGDGLYLCFHDSVAYGAAWFMMFMAIIKLLSWSLADRRRPSRPAPVRDDIADEDHDSCHRGRKTVKGLLGVVNSRVGR